MTSRSLGTCLFRSAPVVAALLGVFLPARVLGSCGDYVSMGQHSASSGTPAVSPGGSLSSIFGGQNNSVRRICGVDSAGNQRPLSAPDNQTGTNANQTFGCPHTGICLFVFCDGTVKPLALSTGLSTLTALATRAGGEVTITDY